MAGGIELRPEDLPGEAKVLEPDCPLFDPAGGLLSQHLLEHPGFDASLAFRRTFLSPELERDFANSQEYIPFFRGDLAHQFRRALFRLWFNLVLRRHLLGTLT